MKKLFLLRHAKSSWADATRADFDRPLNERGQHAAPLIGRYMRERKLRPDLIISSPAERARATAALVIKAAGIDTPLRYDERIYEATCARLFEIVSQIEDAAGEVLLVGHNFGLEELLERLTGEARHMATATLALVTLDIEKWSKLRDRCGRIELFVKAKDLEIDRR